MAEKGESCPLLRSREHPGEYPAFVCRKGYPLEVINKGPRNMTVCPALASGITDGNCTMLRYFSDEALQLSPDFGKWKPGVKVVYQRMLK